MQSIHHCNLCIHKGLAHIIQNLIDQVEVLAIDLNVYFKSILKIIARFHSYLASLKRVKRKKLKKSGFRIYDSSRKRKPVAQLALALMIFAVIFLF